MALLKDWLRNFALTIISILVIFILFWATSLILGYRIRLRETFKKQADKYGLALDDLGKKPIEFLKEELEKAKIGIYLTQEYPSSQGYSYQQSINLKAMPAVMNWQENEQAFWLGIANMIINKNYRNPTLFLDFKGKVNVRADSKGSAGWIETDPNFTYFIKLNGDLQPLVTYRLNPLFVKFANEGNYPVHFGIRGDNELPVDGDFIIRVKK